MYTYSKHLRNTFQITPARDPVGEWEHMYDNVKTMIMTMMMMMMMMIIIIMMMMRMLMLMLMLMMMTMMMMMNMLRKMR